MPLPLLLLLLLLLLLFLLLSGIIAYAAIMTLLRYKDAVKECGNALDVNPSSAKALRHRARALEKQGLYKQALTDIQVGWGGTQHQMTADQQLPYMIDSTVVVIFATVSTTCLLFLFVLAPFVAAAPAAGAPVAAADHQQDGGCQ